MAADVLKYSSGNAASTTLSSSMSNSATSAPLTSDTNFSAKSGEGMVIIDEGTASEEIAYATTKSGSSLTVPLANRGLEGGSAQAHDSQASVKGILTAGMWNSVIDALTNVVSKVTGALDTTKVVDLTTAQTLTNKVLTAPSMTSPSVTSGDVNLATGLNIQVNSADPKRGLYIDGAAMKARTTSGAASSSTETTTNKVMKTGFAFDKDSDEFIQFKIPAPKYWDLGTITATPHWTADAGTTGTVAWAIQALAVSNDDALDTAFGTAVTSTDTFIATGDLHIGPATTAITVGNTPAKGDMLIFQVYRDVSEDTFDADAILIGLDISFGISQYDDQ